MFYKHPWWKSFFQVAFSVYLYVFMEWLFFATKTSFMSPMSGLQKFVLFLVSGLICFLAAFLIMNVIYLISRTSKKLDLLNAILPAFLFAVLALTLIDNFTYTVFKFGIITSSGIWRAAYALLFSSFFIYFLKTINLQFQKKSKKTSPTPIIFILLLITTSIITAIFRIPGFQFEQLYNSNSAPKTLTEKPNIILLGIDGVNAANLSVYGYEKDTTPNITRLAKNALIIENAFSNAGRTGGSLTSLLTGKDPITTKVIYPPDILMGQDAYQHLPGILKQVGYHTVQITDPFFGDAYSRNLKNGFDIANFRSENTKLVLDQFTQQGSEGSLYLVASIARRSIERIEHIFYVNEMINPYQVVTTPVTEDMTQDRYLKMIDALKTTDGPIFLHFHMLNTHGPTFSPRNKIFSSGETQDKSWMPDFYDDAILDSDEYVNNLFDYLEKSGKIDNTLVILYSDHGMEWDATKKVPLIIWFPKNRYTGRVKENVQLLDIAPTILDYLKLPVPIWMSGQSILTNTLSSKQPIFSASATDDLIEGNELDQTKIAPPFYQLGNASMIICNHWYSLYLSKPALTSGTITDSTASCNQDAIPSPQKAEELILQHLKQNGYDISSYPKGIRTTFQP